VAIRSLPIVEGREHLGFRCTSCGNCCRELRVALTHHDLARLQTATGEAAENLVDWLAPDEVDMTGEPASFVELREGRRLMVLGKRNGACRFLDETLRCQVYGARPSDCRLYPFAIEARADALTAKLALLELVPCENGHDGAENAEQLGAADLERWAELEAYQVLVARWNRLARHRQRLGHRARGGREFLEFLGRSQQA
jgi:Fe-S-cluster containining protein